MRCQGIIFLIAFLFLSSLLFAAENPEERNFIFAKKAFNDGFYDLARERFENLLEIYPHTSRVYEIHILLARCLYYQNRLRRAILELEMVLASPGGSEFQDNALYWTGEVYFKDGDFKKALEFYQRIIDNFPSSSVLSYAIYSKAWAYYRLGFLEEANRTFREIVSRYPFEKIAMDSQFRIGECEYLMGRYDKAESELSVFIENFPVSEKLAEAHYMKGEAAFYQNRYKDSIASFSRAVSISPDAKWTPFAVYRMARAYFHLGDYENSVKEFNACLASSGNDFLNSLALLGLVQDYEALARPQEAVKLCDEIIQKHPTEHDTVAEAYYRKAKLLYDQKLYKDSEMVAREATERFPDSEYLDELHYALGWIYSTQGRPDEAAAEFELVGNASGDMNLASSAVCKIGDIYIDKKEYDKAMKNYEVVLNKYPEGLWTDYAQYQIANIFLSIERYDQAILAYQRVLSEFPDTNLREKAMFQLGMAYFNRGDFESAASELKKTIEEFPHGETALLARLHFANALYNLNRYDEALSEFKRIAKESPSEDIRMMARYQSGWCYYNMHKESNAHDEFSRFLKDYPDSKMAGDVKLWFGEYNRSKAKYDKALEYFSSVLKTSSSSDDVVAEALYKTAITLSDEGKTDEAVMRFKELAARFPDSELEKTAYRKIAKLERDNKSYNRAVEYLGKALTSANNETNAQIQYEIGETLEEAADYSEAAKEYLKVPYLYSKGAFWSIRAQLRCAQLFERLEKWEEAKRLYEKLAGMDVKESKLAKGRLEWINWRGEK